MRMLWWLLVPAWADGPVPSIEVALVGVEAERAGTLGCALWDGSEGWPTEDAQALARVVVEPAEARCVFRDIEPGRYAVSVLHDEDGDGRLAKNLLGIPREGWGTTNDRTFPFRGPTFDESVVDFTPDRASVRVSLHY